MMARSAQKESGSSRPTLLVRACDNRELDAERMQNRIDGLIARMRASAEGLVPAFASKPSVFGDLRHPARLSHVAERGKEHLGVGVFPPPPSDAPVMTSSLSR